MIQVYCTTFLSFQLSLEQTWTNAKFCTLHIVDADLKSQFMLTVNLEPCARPLSYDGWCKHQPSWILDDASIFHDGSRVRRCKMIASIWNPNLDGYRSFVLVTIAGLTILYCGNIPILSIFAILYRIVLWTGSTWTVLLVLLVSNTVQESRKYLKYLFCSTYTVAATVLPPIIDGCIYILNPTTQYLYCTNLRGIRNRIILLEKHVARIRDSAGFYRYSPALDKQDTQPICHSDRKTIISTWTQTTLSVGV